MEFLPKKTAESLKWKAGLLAVKCLDFFPERFFFGRGIFGYRDAHHGIEVASRGGPFRQSHACQSEFFSGLGAWRNFEFHASTERGDSHAATQHGIPRGDIQFVNEVSPFDFKIGVPLEFHTKKEIARPGTARSGSTLAGEPDALTLANAFRDFYGVGLEFF